MTLDGEALEDFKRRYEIVFGQRLSDAEARELEADLKHLYRIVRRRSAADGSKSDPIRPPWTDVVVSTDKDPSEADASGR